MARFYWYKRDPDAALVGMVGLTLQERGAYNTIIDLLYSRNGDLDDDDDFMRRAMNCHGNEWRAVKRRLIEKQKIWVTADGKLMAKRVETSLKEAENFSETQRKRVTKRWENEKNAKENNDPPIPAGNTNTTTTTYTIEDSPANAGESAQPKGHVNGRAKGSRLPADWQPTADELAFAEGLGLDGRATADNFRDYWLSRSSGALKLDWHAAFHVWCRKEAGGTGRNRQQRPREQGGSDGIVGSLLRTAARRGLV